MRRRHAHMQGRIRAMNRRKRQLTPEQFQRIYDLYWEEGWTQYEIAELFKRDQSHISRILNGKACSYHCLINAKIVELQKNIMPLKHEPLQGKILRAKRERLPSTKLTWSKVVRMRKLYFTGKYTQMELARKFNCAQSTVSRILSGENWKRIS